LGIVSLCCKLAPVLYQIDILIANVVEFVVKSFEKQVNFHEIHQVYIVEADPTLDFGLPFLNELS